MSKANDNIPADEMLLAEAIAAAMSRGLKWTEGAAFRDAQGYRTTPDHAVECCALGAIHFAGRISAGAAMYPSDELGQLRSVYLGNDLAVWDFTNTDAGESIGWAFRCAMEDA